MGGNRKGTWKTCRNKLIVFLATGLWHGANLTFVVWGLWHGFWIIVEQLGQRKNRKPGVFGHILTMGIVLLGFVVFRADTLTQGLEVIKQMFVGWNFSPAAMGVTTALCSPQFLVTLAVALVLCLPVQMYLPLSWQKREGLQYAGSLCLLFLCLLSLASGTYNPFIYFRF